MAPDAPFLSNPDRLVKAASMSKVAGVQTANWATVRWAEGTRKPKRAAVVLVPVEATTKVAAMLPDESRSRRRAICAVPPGRVVIVVSVLTGGMPETVAKYSSSPDCATVNASSCAWWSLET